VMHSIAMRAPSADSSGSATYSDTQQR
jgi:hypothetical protein